MYYSISYKDDNHIYIQINNCEYPYRKNMKMTIPEFEEWNVDKIKI